MAPKSVPLPSILCTGMITVERDRIPCLANMMGVASACIRPNDGDDDDDDDIDDAIDGVRDEVAAKVCDDTTN